jgi:hypothetical protein
MVLIVSARIANRFKSITVAKQNAIRSRSGLRARYEAVALEFREFAADGLDCQAKIISDVLACHRQMQREAPIAALGKLDQKARDPLGSAQAA